MKNFGVNARSGSDYRAGGALLAASARTVCASLGVAAMCALSASMAPVAFAQPVDPALEQRVSADEPVVTGDPVIIGHGHVDIGPYLDDSGQLQFYARDDASPEPVWRPSDEVTYAVGAAAQMQIPDDGDYSFIGAKPGATVWVVPQTEIADVPWVGWNTQSPSVKDIVGKGVTMEFVEHAGPGEASVFLQPGGFAAPDVLWSGNKAASMWVEPNTHTHANWTFTEPGSHIITIRASIEKPDGQTISADAHLRFAVGIDPMSFTAPDPAKNSSTGFPVWAMAVIGVLVAVVVVGGVAFALFRTPAKKSGSTDTPAADTPETEESSTGE